MSNIIPGLKLIYHNIKDVKHPDNPLLPFKLEVEFQLPEFLGPFLHGLYESEEIILRGKRRKAFLITIPLPRVG